MTFRSLAFAALLIPAVALLRAANDAPEPDEPQNDSKDTPRITHVTPLIKWTFEADEPGAWKG